MSAASLVVRVSADINDFSRQMNQMTREVDRATKKIVEVGKGMSLGITLPVTAATIALSKMAAENEDVAGRMSRVFGRAATTMDASIKQMMRSVPEAQTDLQRMAIGVDHLLLGMGLAPSAATSMSASLLKLAGDAAAFAGVPMADALDQIERGLAGQTRGLVNLGIVIKDADIKQRAYQMGLARTGSELSPTARALAAYNLIMERSTGLQGEAARTADQQGKQFAFLKRDLVELADNLSGLVLPTMSGLAKASRSVVDAISTAPPAFAKTTFAIAGMAALAGPAIVVMGTLTANVNKLTSALKLLSGASALEGLGIALSAIGVAAGLIVAPAVAIAHAFHEEGASARTAAADLDRFRSAVSTLSAVQLKAQAIADQGALQSLEARRRGIASKLATLPAAGTPGYDVNSTPQQASALAQQLNSVVAQQTAVRSNFDVIIKQLSDMNAVAAGGGGGGGGGGTSLADQLKAVADRASLITTSIEQMKHGWEPIVGLGAAWADTLKSAQAILARIPNQMDPIAVKARDIVLALREIWHDLDVSHIPGVQITRPAPSNPLVGLPPPHAAPLPPEPLVKPLTHIEQATRAGFAQVAVAIGDTLATNLATLMGGRGIGAQIGGSIGGAFGGGFLGSLINFGGSSALALAGNAVVPVVGGVIGTLLGGALGGLFGHHKQAVDNSASALDTLARTTQRVNEALSNLPEGFKIARDRYLATVPATAGSGGTGGGGTGGGTGGGPIVPGASSGTIVVQGDLHVNGVNVSNAGSLVRAIADAAKANLNRGGAGLLLAATRA